MRAVTVPEYGATPSVTEVPRPEPGPGEILVRMGAAGLNPFDWKIVDGALKDAVEAKFPLVMGVDGAGTVEALGEGVTSFAVGEPVFGQFSEVGRGLGSYAEYAIGKVSGAVARMPEGMIPTQAAAVPTAMMTAANMVNVARVDEGQTVLVVGATGGVGQAAVQFAADTGAKVIATAKPDMADEMRRLGAAATVDHTGGGLGGKVLAVHREPLDAILMVAPSQEAEALAGLLKPGGAYVSSVFNLNPDKLAAQEIRAVNYNNEASARLLAQIADMVDAGRVTVRIHQEVPLEAAPDAVAASRAGGARGKTVIRL